MSALQLWLQNHNRRLTQDAIDEALMEYITHVESQRDALKQQRDELVAALEYHQEQTRPIQKIPPNTKAPRKKPDAGPLPM